MLYDRTQGKLRELTEGLDQTTHNIRWSHDSSHLYFDSEYVGTQQAFEINATTGRVRQRTNGQFDFHLLTALPKADGFLVSQQSMLRPMELALVHGNENVVTLTSINEDAFKEIELPMVEERWVRASDGKQIHNWVILPPKFDPSKSYPMLVYCQGGPQGKSASSFPIDGISISWLPKGTLSWLSIVEAFLDSASSGTIRSAETGVAKL